MPGPVYPPIAVWYHCKLCGEGIPSMDAAIGIIAEQMVALEDSGLAQAAAEFHVGVNGSEDEAMGVACLTPGKPIFHHTPERGEQTTIRELQKWLPAHPDWLVCYHHSKGVSNNNEVNQRWRRCMQRAVIERWRECVEYLNQGKDTVGAHWFINQDQRYWAGNFWWAKAGYLLGLPAVSRKTINGRSYEAEAWIGKARIAPRILDLAPHAPMRGCPP